MTLAEFQLYATGFIVGVFVGLVLAYVVLPGIVDRWMGWYRRVNTGLTDKAPTTYHRRRDR